MNGKFWVNISEPLFEMRQKFQNGLLSTRNEVDVLNKRVTDISNKLTELTNSINSLNMNIQVLNNNVITLDNKINSVIQSVYSLNYRVGQIEKVIYYKFHPNEKKNRINNYLVV